MVRVGVTRPFLLLLDHGEKTHRYGLLLLVPKQDELGGGWYQHALPFFSMTFHLATPGSLTVVHVYYMFLTVAISCHCYD